MKTIISRPPNDEFTFDLFLEVSSIIGEPNVFYYGWSANIEPLIHQLSQTKFDQEFCVIAIKDSFPFLLYEWFNQIAGNYPKTKFIILTSCEVLESQIVLNKNLFMINFGGDGTNQHAKYINLNPIIDKNLNSDKIYSCFVRRTVPHRLAILHYLFGKNLYHFGELSCLVDAGDYSVQLLLTELGLNSDNYNEEFLKIFEVGSVLRDQNRWSLMRDNYEIYQNNSNDNFNNFNNKLAPIYQHVFVEIVAETNIEFSYNMTEKTMHAFYACNFPIIISTPGSVSYLRSIGFDMFDDIIDHNYDLIKDPLIRIKTAIDKNQRMLTDIEYVKYLWKENINRFLKNVSIAKNLHLYFRCQTINKINDII